MKWYYRTTTIVHQQRILQPDEYSFVELAMCSKKHPRPFVMYWYRCISVISSDKLFEKHDLRPILLTILPSQSNAVKLPFYSHLDFKVWTVINSCKWRDKLDVMAHGTIVVILLQRMVSRWNYIFIKMIYEGECVCEIGQANQGFIWINLHFFPAFEQWRRKCIYETIDWYQMTMKMKVVLLPWMT